MTANTDKILENLREKGHRITSQRKQLLSFFYTLDKNEHLNAEELHKKLINANIKISLATLYRSLKFLVENHFIRELDFGEDHKHYELFQKNRQHHHLICNKCGSTSDFKDEKMIKYINNFISTQKEFEVMDYEFKVFGVCMKCR